MLYWLALASCYRCHCELCQWHDNGPQGLVMVSVCIQIAINEMHLCSLSVAYACPYHNPTAAMGHLAFANSSLTQCHTRSAWHSENRDSSVKRTLLQSARRHRRWAFAHSSWLQWQTTVRSRPWWGRRKRKWAFLRRFLTVVQKLFGGANQLFVCLGGWSQTILQVKKPDMEVWGWCGYTWSVVVGPVGCTAKFLETTLETAYGSEMNIQFMGNSSGGHSCSQYANCTLPRYLRHCVMW